MNDDTTHDEGERDTLLLEALMAVVPNAHFMHDTVTILAKNGAETTITDMLKGYGTLLNIVQAAIEQPEAFGRPMTMHERLSAAYYELTNNDDGGDTEVRLIEP